MIELTKRPAKFSSVYRPVIYTLIKTGAEKESVQILHGAEVAGIKQFTREGIFPINVAEYYRPLIRTAPVIDDGLSFIHAAERTVTANLDILADSSVVLTSGINDLLRATLLSNAPGPRKIAPGEWDELSYLVDEEVLAGAIVVTMRDGSEVSFPMPNASIDGIAVLVVHYDSIAESLRLRSLDPDKMAKITVRPTLGCFDLPEVEYKVVRSAAGVRIAWWNRRGGIDYFTFKTDLDKSYTTERTKIRTAEGWRTVASEVEDERNITTEALPSWQLEWLGEIVSAPKVWLIERSTATPIDITSDNIIVYDVEGLSQLQLTFRSIDTEKMQTL